MADVRVQISDDTIQSLQDKLEKGTKATDITRDALTLYKWAVDERAKGNVLLSSDESGVKLTRLAMPSLEAVAKRP